MKAFLLKFLILMVVGVVLVIAGSMVRGVVSDRMHYRDEAQKSITEGLAGGQSLAGVVMVLSYTEHYTEDEVVNAQTGVTRVVARSELHTAYQVLPETLLLNGDLKNDTRYRGIFHVNTYTLRGDLSGEIEVPLLKDLPRNHAGSTLELDGATLALGVQDPRGLRSLQFTLGGQDLPQKQPGTGLAGMSSGVSAVLSEPQKLLGQRLKYTVALELAGTQSLNIVPLARDNKAMLKSPWPHPSFAGRFLPMERHVTDAGFEAVWNVSEFATNARQAWLSKSKATDAVMVDDFSVVLIDPVDIYVMSDRASKYAELFIVLTLGAFCLLELLRRLRLHPLQYFMVGGALVLFFLLLLAFSEHVGFSMAYLIASAACVSLIGFYALHLLRSAILAAAYTGGLALLYGALYFILLSEQNALLMGSTLLFAILAAVMVATRKVDWHAVFGSSVPARQGGGVS